LCPLSRTVPRTAETGRRMSVGAIAKTIARRFGDDVATHDLRRTFVCDALDSGADLSVVSQLVGHTNPATTAGYDRRGHTARLPRRGRGRGWWCPPPRRPRRRRPWRGPRAGGSRAARPPAVSRRPAAPGRQAAPARIWGSWASPPGGTLAGSAGRSRS